MEETLINGKNIEAWKQELADARKAAAEIIAQNVSTVKAAFESVPDVYELEEMETFDFKLDKETISHLCSLVSLSNELSDVFDIPVRFSTDFEDYYGEPIHAFSDLIRELQRTSFDGEEAKLFRVLVAKVVRAECAYQRWAASSC